MTGKDYEGYILEFAEKCFWTRELLETDTAKLERRFSPGIWVGKSEITDENILLTKEGVRGARSVQCIPESSRWAKVLLGQVRGLPWN